MRRIVWLAAGWTAALAFASGVHAQAWPAKPVRLVISNTAGSTTDLVGRLFADAIQGPLGKPWLIENRPGADEMIGAEAVARSAPDGYTLFFATSATLAINPHTKKNLPVDTAREFVPVAIVADSTGGFVIASTMSTPFKNLPEMVAYAKANPGKLTYATTVPFFAIFGEWLKKRAAIDLLHVPYKNTGQSLQDTASGVVSMGFLGYATVQPFVKAGKIKVLAVAARTRQEDIPDIAPVAETFPDFNMDSWVAVVAPVATPMEVIRRINREAQVVVKDPKFQAGLKKTRWANVDGARTPEGAAEFVRRERERWGEIIRAIGRVAG